MRRALGSGQVFLPSRLLSLLNSLKKEVSGDDTFHPFKTLGVLTLALLGVLLLCGVRWQDDTMLGLELRANPLE